MVLVQSDAGWFVYRISHSKLSTASGNIRTSVAFAVSFTTTSSSCGFTSNATVIGDDDDDDNLSISAAELMPPG